MRVFIANFLLLQSALAQSAVQLKEISQPDSLQTLKLGDSATIQCYIQSKMTKRVWYKLTAGRRLQLVATFDSRYIHSVLMDEFQHRFSVKFDSISSHLSISETSWDDAGTYFCGVMFLNDIQFGSGTFLMLKGAKMISDSVVQRPESQSVRSGDSVTLNCSVHSDPCDAEHTSVMWLKNSHQSAAEMIHSSGNNSCQRTEGGGTTCVYHLLMRNISSEDAGNYYCVVTSCGRVLFGNGTSVDINTYKEGKPLELSVTIVALMLSNILLGIVALLLVWILCKTRRKHSTEVTGGSSGCNQSSDAVVYSAVCSTYRSHAPRQATDTDSGDSVVYSNIRNCQQNRDVSTWDCRQTQENEDRLN